jgi:replicative DNA helicase
MTDSGVGAVSRPDTIAPHSAEAEEAVLGSILINPDAIFEVAAFLQASDFFIVRNAWIYEAINAVHDRGEAIDNLTVIQELRNRGQLESVGGSAYIAYLMNNTPTHIHAETYGHIVERAAIRRRLLTAASEIAQTALEENAEINEVIDRVESTLFSVTERRLRKDLIPVRQAVSEYFNRIEYLYTHQDEPLGLPTGFIDLDKLLGGLQRSDLCIVAARPGVGKTSFMLSIALNAARARPSKPTTIAIFSMEMSTEQLIQRFIAAETSINSQKLRLGNLDEREWGLFVEATGKLSNLRLFLDDTPAVSVPQIRTKCRRLYREHGLDLIIVDYLQLMSAGIGRNENRVQEISYISRGLKELARELNVPLLSAAQLSRAVEQRQDKRPQLSDLRESGCLAGDTLIYWPERGCYIPIRKLAGQAGFCVSSLNTDTWKLETAEVTNAFCTGVKPVFHLTTQLGRSIRATANHKFLTFDGWKRLDELTENDFVAVPRTLDGPSLQTMSDSELALLGHLIGDGCMLPRHAIQYTTRERDLADLVASLAVEVFGDKIAPRINPERRWYQVYLSSAYQLTHGVRNPVSVWLDNLGIFGLRSFEKRVPDKVFEQPREAIARFLRHLWATDGCIRINTGYPAIYYASSSPRLASDIQTLLLRLGINARLKRVSQNGKGRDQYHVIVTGNQDMVVFAETIGAVGLYKQQTLALVSEYAATHPANTNRDVIPKGIWRMHAVPVMQQRGITSRKLHVGLGNAYCGAALYKQNIGRERAARLAQVVGSQAIARLAESDVYWDKIVSIEPDGETDVYDLTVPGLSNFVANNIIVHNSIEQDADVVMFIYRDDLYNENSDRPNQADILVSKHRNGPTGVITLYFKKEITQFTNMQKSNINLAEGY